LPCKLAPYTHTLPCSEIIDVQHGPHATAIKGYLLDRSHNFRNCSVLVNFFYSSNFFERARVSRTLFKEGTKFEDKQTFRESAQVSSCSLYTFYPQESFHCWIIPNNRCIIISHSPPPSLPPTPPSAFSPQCTSVGVMGTSTMGPDGSGRGWVMGMSLTICLQYTFVRSLDATLY